MHTYWQKNSSAIAAAVTHHTSGSLHLATTTPPQIDSGYILPLWNFVNGNLALDLYKI